MPTKQQHEPETSWLDPPFEQWVIETRADLARKARRDGGRVEAAAEIACGNVLVDADAAGP